MTIKGADFGWGPAAGQEDAFAGAMKAAGFSFVCRYLSRVSSKNLTGREIAAYRKAGIRIVTVFEDTANRALGGGSAGVMDGQFCRQRLRALGAPSHAPVYFAADFDAEAQTDIDRVHAYVKGAAQVLGWALTGIYGGIKVTAGSGFKYHWQTVAWSHGFWEPGADIRQFAAGGRIDGVSWDLDDVPDSEGADYGFWRFPGDTTGIGSGGGQKAGPAAVHKEEDMILAKGEHALAIPKGTKQLHFAAAGDVGLDVHFHGKDPEKRVALSKEHGSHYVDVPDGVHAAVITATGEVTLAYS